ncbi:hypothetical protein J7394_19990 [Ruegeria sp. R13_0]|uniref:hypothetical protein n=1 Tax=Ruegeria sp. R13_0 TaxID=2821099 RepID=UPI001ADA958D|nr:hypothetical protein [Ruegeria sp. R13_0]MBO9436505.1 hypothetical protein [Ruegeria sp. R13_0]
MEPGLVCLSAMREARAKFYAGVEAHAAAHCGLDDVALLDREDRKTLRSDAVAQIAEFFYVLKYSKMKIPGDLEGFLRRHNDDMAAMEASCRNGYTVGGLSLQRLKRAKFSDPQINYVLHESESGEPRFDQQSLQRIFTQIMSFETCRNVLLVLAQFGLLRRWDFNLVLIGSDGTLEGLYRAHLEEIVDAVRSS